MRIKGYNPTDLAMRGNLLKLQTGGRDINGNWVNSSKDGSTSILQSHRLWQETDKRTVCAEVLKAATAQVEQVTRVQTRKEVRHRDTRVSTRAHLGTSPLSPPASPPYMEAETPMDIIETSGPMPMKVDTSISTPLAAETPATLPATVGPPWPTLKVTYSGHTYRIPVLLSSTTVAELFGELLPRITGKQTLPRLPKVLHLEIRGKSWPAGGDENTSTTLGDAGCLIDQPVRARGIRLEAAPAAHFSAVNDTGVGGGDDDGDSDDGGGDGSEATPSSHGGQPPASEFAVGDRVWYVKIGEYDRPGNVVAVHWKAGQPR